MTPAYGNPSNHMLKLALEHMHMPSCRCPYYRFAEQGLYGALGTVDDADTDYFKALANATLASCNGSFLTAASAKASARPGGCF